MALIDVNDFKLVNKNRNSKHYKVKTTYTYFEIDGKKYFQIDTYGKSTHKEIEKLSQSIQLDEESAKLLVKMLYDYFNFRWDNYWLFITGYYIENGYKHKDLIKEYKKSLLSYKL